jgi:hypothetical protein
MQTAKHIIYIFDRNGSLSKHIVLPFLNPNCTTRFGKIWMQSIVRETTISTLSYLHDQYYIANYRIEDQSNQQNN